ncbi:uncharacterized protein LOC143212787 [Lasioglossum baleicum]|uniref:uncharacterized protein LOC143212787 n=1 Tax=Lasioglossum baleicum TaxID=434251 RepID=UPI003FCED276
MIGSIESRFPNCALRNFPSRNIFSRIMEGRKAVCLCLLALACLQAIQNISATKALLESVLGDLRPSDCDSPYGIIGENPAPLPTSKFELAAELLHIRRLLERGCRTFGSPLNGPLSGALGSPLNGPLSGGLSSPLNGPLSGILGSPLNGPLSGGLSSPLNGAFSSPLNGALSSSSDGVLAGGLSSPVGGLLSSSSLGSGLTNFPPNILHGSFSGLLHR